MKFTALAPGLLFTAFTGSPAFATSLYASDLAGQVVDENRRPVADAVVAIYHIETGRLITTTTNRKGRYLAAGLRSDGNYGVIFMHPTRQCGVAFLPGHLTLGQKIKRNAVLCQPENETPSFMRTWQWRQDESNLHCLTTDRTAEGS